MGGSQVHCQVKTVKHITWDLYASEVSDLYAREVTWLEATIACPIFSGLVTYYIEGEAHERHHLMEDTVAQPLRAYAVRGNIFSFLMDWDKIQDDLSKLLGQFDVWQWPMEPQVATQVVRVRLVRGPEDLLNKFKELRVRAEIVRQVAYLYIERHLKDLAGSPGARELQRKMQGLTLQESLKKHVEQRVHLYYPDARFPLEGGGLLEEMVENAEKNKVSEKSASAYDFKQTTMPDSATADYSDVFAAQRPTLVLDEANVDNQVHKNVQMEHALGQIAEMDISMSNRFEDQWVTRYLSRIFPWALNFNCGGPEYPHLFNSSAWDAIADGNADPLALAVGERWRRLASAPCVTPGPYVQMLATRSEAQLGADWMAVPAARNLHWRYQVLRQAFVVCREKVAPGEDAQVNLEVLMAASTKLFERLQKGFVKVHGKPLPVNGDFSLLFRADDLTPAEKTILKCYLNVTRSIAGCQALRRRIGHCLFGFRVVYGECIFVTVSPSRRHSHLLMRLSRIRRNDTMAQTSTGSSMHVANRERDMVVYFYILHMKEGGGLGKRSFPQGVTFNIAIQMIW